MPVDRAQRNRTVYRCLKCFGIFALSLKRGEHLKLTIRDLQGVNWTTNIETEQYLSAVIRLDFFFKNIHF